VADLVEGRFSTLRRHRYAVLLPLLVVSLAIQSINAGVGADRWLSNIVLTVLGVATLIVVFERRRERVVMAIVVASMVGFAWSGQFVSANVGRMLAFGFHVLKLLLLVTAVWVILRGLFRGPAASADKVMGAISGYLLAGDAWAGANAIAYLVVPSAYAISAQVAFSPDDLQSSVALFSYYSIAQMLTLGYSDVTPVRAPATTLSLFTTLFGVFYTAVVVAQVVGLAQSVRRERHHDE